MINNLIQKYKKAKIKNIFYNDLIIFSILYLTILIFFLICENIFYLNQLDREKIFALLFIILISFFVYSLLKIFFNSTNRKSITNNELIAKEIGQKVPKISDKLLNAYQLSNIEFLNKTERNLSKIAIKKTEDAIKKDIPYNLLPAISRNNKLVFSSFIIIFLIVLFTSENLKFSAYRIYNYKVYFEPPTPFKIGLPKQYSNIDAMDGDDIIISFLIDGELPNDIFIMIDNGKQSHLELINVDNDSLNYTFSNVKSNFKYRLMSFSESLFSKWDTIESPIGLVNVSHWPEISDIELLIHPPEYTDLDPVLYDKLQPQFRALENSKIIYNISSNQALESMTIFNNDLEKIQLENNNSKSWITNIKFDSTMEQKIILKNFIGNTNKLDYQYQIKLLKDFSPELYVINPQERILEINNESKIKIEFMQSDDYGLRESFIEFSVVKPDYMGADSSSRYININKYKNAKRAKEVFTWNLNTLNLFPGDEVKFKIVTRDNNPNSLGITKSKQFNAIYPSLEDIYSSLEEEEKEITDLTNSTLEEIDEIDKVLEDIKLDLLKATDISLENQQKVNESLDRMDEVLNEISEMDDVLNSLKQQAENNNILDNDLMEKFSQFQELLNDIMTPEMMEAMQKMQQAMDEMDLNEMLEAVENFDYNLEQFESQLERFIDMFELAIAEQKIDELVASLEIMNEEQIKIQKFFEQQQSLKKITSMQSRQNERFEKFQETMREAQKSVEKFSKETSLSINDLISSKLNLETQEALDVAQKKLSKDDYSAINSISESKQNLNKMKKIAEQIKSDFSSDLLREMIALFYSVIDNVLKLSSIQEELIDSSDNLRISNPKVRTHASKQFIISKQFLKFIEQIMTLSTKTFYISPDINKVIGKCKKSIDNSILNLEQRKVKTARNEQKNILASMNEIGLMLIISMSEMQENQSASGLSSYMEELQEISQGQSEINMSTMQLGQMGMMQQGDMMRQLQQQQKALQEKLQQILDELQGQEQGGLSKASDDMLDVAEQFNQNRVSKETSDKQNKILSRLLDSQKSLKEKDYSEKRKESIAEQKPYSESYLIQEKINEKNITYMNAMENALDQGYSEEYKKMFRKYYRGLLEIENK